MDPLHAVLRIHQCADPRAAFQALAEGLGSTLPLRSALYLRADAPDVDPAWPEPVALTDELRAAALQLLHPEVLPLGGQFAADAALFPRADALCLPLHRDAGSPAACLLIADAGAFGEDPEPWRQVRDALETFEAAHRRTAAAEARCEELQRRVEESEALHTLGLAANRTLETAEVLGLVARFTRTLLGAHYVMVNTGVRRPVFTVASVGLRNPETTTGDYELALAVIEAQKPLTVGEDGANLRVSDFPLHAAEGLRSGLGIPLSLFGESFGALIVGYRAPREITPRDIRLALSLAGHAAVAISNARLHETVEERSRELETAYAELNRVSTSKERFFASINHELRNPLGAVLGYLQLALEGTGGELPEAARRYLEKAARAAGSLRTLVNDILDLSKLAAGKMEVELQPCRVERIVEDALVTVQPLADDKGIPLRVSFPEELPTALTDPGRAQQILVNLLSNALKFTSSGEVSVSATPGVPGSDEPAEAWLELRVSDTGPGIEAADLARVFEEYEQVKGTRGGTGLGLPISRRLARLLHGDLWAQSEPGHGSTFTLRLPTQLAARESARPG